MFYSGAPVRQKKSNKKKKSTQPTNPPALSLFADRQSEPSVRLDEIDNPNEIDRSDEDSDTESSGPPERHPEFFFDNTLIAIQVKRTLFNVHKYQLAKSEVFSERFKIRKAEGDGPEEGSSPDYPIKLKGVSASDFAALLRVLYASHFSSNQPAPEAPLIIPAFRLAHMFKFSELRAYLLPLAEENLNDVDKIAFAREFGIKQWLAPAHIRLCEREEHLSGEEARKLGVESVLIISRMREQHRNKPSSSPFVTNNYYCNGCIDTPLGTETKDFPTLASRLGAGYWVFVDETSVTKSGHGSANTLNSSLPKTIKRHSKFCFDDILVAIQIEDTLFNVHKYQLAKSEIFSDMFKVPKPKGDGPEEGSSLEHPIVLKGVSASDFAALLTVLYASHFSNDHPAPEASLIIPAFRLANMFNFSELRAFLLPFAEEHLDDIDKIVFAREFDIKKWLAPAHLRLCLREAPLNGEEAGKLGIESVLIISRMREQQRPRPPSSSMIVNHPYCSTCTGFTPVGVSTCRNCSTRSSTMRYDGLGTFAQNGTTTDSTAIEARVEKWVEDGCILKD
ncbi:unnamed protein product [Rhizoctonia solani]|uniref:BTB domain-containing protein n=1 Tax=Rhizoctonia solani TaxID=456999 RepID=A0A8H3HN67_9AGAM|nr:unnamed protein product [Rhizoctonia solani]